MTALGFAEVLQLSEECRGQADGEERGGRELRSMTSCHCRME